MSPDDRLEPVGTLGVADAKRRFSDLLDRAERGERFVIARRGKPAAVLVPPGTAARARIERPIGFAALAGALGDDWPDIEAFVEEVYRARSKARDREPPAIA